MSCVVTGAPWRIAATFPTMIASSLTTRKADKT
jgi:hypothetical protein